MPSEETILQLRQQIKNWEYEFQETNKRVPTRLDIKSNAKISKLYKTYRYIRENKSQVKQPQRESPKGINIDLDDKLVDDVSEEENEDLANFTELGPTPQANGKVLSILDLRMTPPHSSPLKRKSTQNIEDSDIFKTPTKSKVITSNPGTLAKLSISQQLLSIANKTPTKTPKQVVAETPSYLGRVNSRNFETNLQNSPTKFKIPISPSKLVTPTKPPPQLNFSVSPSPLKSHRFMSKKLSQVFNDFKAIQQDQLHLEIDEEFDKEFDKLIHDNNDELQQDDEPGKSRKKQKTQKRSTRRWKIKPKESVNDGEDLLHSRNLHSEIEKIETETVDTLKNLGKSDDENGESSESDDEYHQQDLSNTKGMVKQTRNNYKRLKINDPRTKRFKNRYKR